MEDSSMRALTLAFFLATSPVTASYARPLPIAAAVAAKDRPAEAVALDASRRPVEVLSFMRLKPGMKAFDLLTGTGYYAEIMGRAVGPTGSVVAYSPANYNPEPIKAAFATLVQRVPNVKFVTNPAEAFAPSSYDFAMIHLNYHDFYFESEKYNIPRTDPDIVLKTLFGAMKPGGIVAVIDHVGPAGDTRAIVDRVHRIDPATVRADFARAGFVLDGESSLLAMRGDDHTKNVFDPAIRGKTDRMTLRFKKPK
jgi:predicted methyltransferase